MLPFRLSALARHRLPEQHALDLEAWVNDGARPNDVLLLVLCNQVLDVAFLAPRDLHELPALLAVIAMELPRECFGSTAAVHAWRATKLLERAA